MDKREWHVQITAMSSHDFVVEARTAEEAEAIAGDLLNDGADRDVIYEIDCADAWPADEDDEPVDDDEDYE
jgi:hypothetical protein